MRAAPFAYVITEHDGWGAEVLSVGQTLAQAIAPIRESSINGCALGHQQLVTAYFPDGSCAEVPRVAYAVQVQESDEAILAWIRERIARVALERVVRPGQISVDELSGSGRCAVDDTEDKQLADYKATAPWAWCAEPEETWWRK